MNIYLLTQNEKTGYDTFDSCVVIAKDENEAINIHPNNNHYGENGRWYWVDCFGEKHCKSDRTWASKPGLVNVELVGTSIENIKRVICASFNAG